MARQGTLLIILAGLLVASGIFAAIPTTKAQTTDDFIFTAVGDWGCTNNTNTMANVMSSKNPEVVLGLGDYSYQTTMDCWHDILAKYPTIHNAVHQYNSLSFGNHEDDDCPDCSTGTNLDTAGEAEYLAHFNQPPTFFSFDHKRVHFLTLDSHQDSGAQYDFISNDLATAAQNPDIDWIIAYMHHPMYTSFTSSGHTKNATGMRAAYQPLFDQYGVDLVLQGHVHAYERMKPMEYNAMITHYDEVDYVDPEGQIYVTVGTGGKSLPYPYSSDPEMSVFQLLAYGFLQVEITPTTLKGKFIDNTNIVRDAFQIVKTGNPEPEPTTITDVWASSHNTAEYVNNYQLKAGEKITDPNRQEIELESATFYMHRTDGTTPAGSLRAALFNFDTNTLIATSTNSILRSDIIPGYNPYTFNFPSNTITPNANFAIVIECISCDSTKLYIGAHKNADQYPDGNLSVFRGGAWKELVKDTMGSATYILS